MATYGWTLDYVKFGMTGAQGWVWYNWAVESLIYAFGPVYKRTTEGYVKQEMKRIRAQRNKKK